MMGTSKVVCKTRIIIEKSEKWHVTIKIITYLCLIKEYNKFNAVKHG
jgi:hypothetical protein